jgi:hypothetical protein
MPKPGRAPKPGPNPEFGPKPNPEPDDELDDPAPEKGPEFEPEPDHELELEPAFEVAPVSGPENTAEVAPPEFELDHAPEFELEPEYELDSELEPAAADDPVSAWTADPVPEPVHDEELEPEAAPAPELKPLPDAPTDPVNRIMSVPISNLMWACDSVKARLGTSVLFGEYIIDLCSSQTPHWSLSLTRNRLWSLIHCLMH